MEKHVKVSSRFRAQLKHHLQIWEQDNIITPQQAATITEKYRLDRIAKETTSKLVFAIYVIGSALVAAGVISFVAAHWDKVTPAVKVLLIVAFMIACHASGFYLWQLSGKSPRLGHALIVLGTLIFGANIGLFAQIFHIKANFYNGFFAWAIGAILMAYAVQSVPNAIVAVIVSFIGFCGWVNDNPYAFCFYPFVAAALFFPFACLRRSVLTFLFSLLAIAVSVMVYAAFSVDEFLVFSLATAAVGFLCFGLGLVSQRTTSIKSFAQPAMALGSAFVALNSYLFSFLVFAEEVTFSSEPTRSWYVPVISVFCIGAVAWAWRFKSVLENRRLRPIAIAVLVSTALSLVAIFGQRLPTDYEHDIWVVTCSNIAALVLCVGLVANAFVVEDRRLFWAGILFLTLVITSRFLEYETDLLIKAAVFITCGIGLIFAGVRFEHYLKKGKLENE